MVLFSIPPFPRWQDLGCHLALPPLLVDLFCDSLCFLFLLGVVIEDSASVLRTPVWALLVLRCRVVHLVKELEKRAVCDLVWVVDYLKGFGVCYIC